MKEIKTGGHLYKIRALTSREVSQIEDEGILAIPGEKGRIMWGKWKNWHCFLGIKEWDLKDEKGAVLLITYDNVLDHMSREDVDMIAAEVWALTYATESEKKT